MFSKPTNFTFVSPWPKGSPFYYNPTPCRWGMEFAGGGYFIHDAWWESTGSYGPGGQNNQQAASHGSRPHADTGDGVGVLLDTIGTPGGHQRLTSKRARMFL